MENIFVGEVVEQYGILAGVLGVIGLVLITFTYRYYLAAITQAGPSRESLKRRLEQGGDPRRVYVSVIATILDSLDELIGDQGTGRRGHKHPDWSGKLFDACALLAMIYPFASLLLTWVLAGDAGPVGLALGLSPDTSFQSLLARLSLAVALAMATVGAVLRFAGEPHLATVAAVIAGTLGTAAAGAGAGAAAIVAGVVLGVGAVFIVGFGQIFLRLVIFCAAAALGVPFLDADWVEKSIHAALSIALIVGIVAAALVGVHETGRELRFVSRRQTFVEKSRFSRWFLVYPVMLVAATWTPNLVSTLPLKGQYVGTVVAAVPFLGLFPMINLPFDWISIGLTRRLLRWGLEPGAPHPFVIAFLDLLLATILLVLLAAITIMALHLVNVGAQVGGHLPPFPLEEIFSELRANPANPKHAWIYLILFSTLLPSLLNVIVATTALAAWPIPTHQIRIAIERYEQGHTAPGPFLALLLTATWVMGVGFVAAALWWGGRALLQFGQLGPALIDSAAAFAGWSELIVRTLAESVGRLAPH